MSIHQISVFLENRAGQLAEMTALLSANKIDMRAISIAETADYGVLRLIVDDSERTASILLSNGFIVSMTPVVAVAVPDEPGGLSRVLRILAQAGIDIEYMYALVGRLDTQACMIFRVGDEEKLYATLAANGLSAIPGEELGIR
jgi:hypothetical protein